MPVLRRDARCGPLRAGDDALVVDAVVVEGAVDAIQHVQREGGDTRSERAFKEPFARRRCVVPVAGFYEWAKRRRAQLPYYIRPRADDGLLLAGVWDRWRNGDESASRVLRSSRRRRMIDSRSCTTASRRC